MSIEESKVVYYEPVFIFDKSKKENLPIFFFKVFWTS